MKIYSYSYLFSAGALALLMSACASTTGSFEGSTNTSGNTTEASSKLTSSTSPSGDDEAAQAQRVREFARANHTQLRSDMAVGQGEYLTSLAVLMKIEESQRDDFYAMTKDRFERLYSSAATTPEQMVAQLYVEFAH